MESLIVNIVLGSFLILFAAMALFPLFASGTSTATTRKHVANEDRVIRIEHKAILERRSQAPTLVPVPNGDSHRVRPAQRTAA